MTTLFKQLSSIIGRRTLGLVYPSTCASCRLSLPEEHASLFCPGCLAELAIITGPSCPRCGAVSSEILPGSEGCGGCRGLLHKFERTIALGEYHGLLRHLILETKHHSGEPLARSLAELLWQQRGEELIRLKVDFVVPMPMHWRRRLVRQINAAEQIGEVLAGRLAVPESKLLRFGRATLPQRYLAPSERLLNVRQAIAVRKPAIVQEKHILLVDDVFTTGATCSEAARALKKAGAREVSVAVLARSWTGR